MTNNPRVALLNPVVESITLSDTALAIGQTSTVTITFSEIVIFNNSNVTAQNGTLSTFISPNLGITWIATFTPNANVQSATNVINVNSNYTNLLGIHGSSATSGNYTVDTVAPIVSSILMSNTALNIGSTSNVIITFSKAVTGFSNADVTVQNGTLSTLSSSDGGISWTGVFTPNLGVKSTMDVISISANYTDLAGNAGSSATSVNYTIDTIAPVVSSITLSNAALHTGTTSTVTITFSETVTGFSNADVTVQNGTLSTLVSSDGGLTWTGIFTPNSGIKVNTNVISVGANYTDLAGNQGSGATSSNYTIDTTGPFVNSIIMSDTTLNIGATANVTITFSEPVIGFNNSNCTAQNGSLSLLTSVDGIIWTGIFTPDSGINASTNVITIDANYTDLVGNHGSAGSSSNYTIDTIAPAVVSIVMSNPILNIGAVSTLTITFSEAVTDFSNSDVIAPNGSLSLLTSLDGGITWTCLFTPSLNVNATTNVISVGPNYTDLAGNIGVGIAVSANYIVNTLAASVVAITLSDTALNIGDTSLVTIIFSEPVIGFSNADVTVQNGTLSTLISLDLGITWQATLTPNANVTSNTNVITVGPSSKWYTQHFNKL